ncbi:hypothetical protein RISK_005846 [Rhodopirellula islandica]|uniref:Uncharacterized protein n=1 Tax=Rhodopirellula islandica TaxID=595434 RepID=A0A0J1B6R4_RHOIS|nr:hypothetical protein RISK_005846 [Rhodopirellula islandica]
MPSACDLGLETQGFRLPSLRDWSSVSGPSNNRGAVTVVSLGFSTRGLGHHHLARQAAERRQVAGGDGRWIEKVKL